MYKWVCAVQIGVAQGSAVFVSNHLSPLTLRATPNRVTDGLWVNRGLTLKLLPLVVIPQTSLSRPVEAPKPWQNDADTQSTCPYLGWHWNCVVLDAQSCLFLCSPMDCSLLDSTEFSRQEYWNGLPFPSPRDLPDSGIKPGSPALQADSLPFEPPQKPSWN